MNASPETQPVRSLKKKKEDVLPSLFIFSEALAYIQGRDKQTHGYQLLLTWLGRLRA